jgi:hypothetical protein
VTQGVSSEFKPQYTKKKKLCLAQGFRYFSPCSPSSAVLDGCVVKQNIMVGILGGAKYLTSWWEDTKRTRETKAVESATMGEIKMADS